MAATGGALLIASVDLPWYSSMGFSWSAWDQNEWASYMYGQPLFVRGMFDLDDLVPTGMTLLILATAIIVSAVLMLVLLAARRLFSARVVAYCALGFSVLSLVSAAMWWVSYVARSPIMSEVVVSWGLPIATVGALLAAACSALAAFLPAGQNDGGEGL